MNKLLFGTRKGLFIYDRTSSGWEMERHGFEGIPVQYAMHDPRNGLLWASLDHGHWGVKLSRSEDGGESWEEVEAPKYPEGAEISDGVPATTKLIWCLEPGGPDQPGRLYAGTEPGGLFVSDDSGDSFELVDSLWEHPSRKAGQWFGGGRDNAAIHSVVVDPRDSDRVQVGISCAGVFETVDGGETWHPQNKGLAADFLPSPDVEVGHDPHILVACPSEPDHLWQQNHCGVFRSTDGGDNWEDVSTDDGIAYFGFTAAVDDEDPDTAWLVPGLSDECRITVDGGIFVSRTEDGGQTWTAFREGLPQEQAYDITYRHALDVHGDTLAFGTTTGNAFASFDRGESWQTLSNYLPPVYSVRFANW